MFVARFQQRTLREYLNGTSNRPPGRHRIQNAEGPVLDPCAKQIISEGTQKWTLSGSKVVPPGGPVFGPFILSDVLKFCKLLCAQNVKLEATDTNSITRQDSWTGEARICVSNFSYLLGPKNRPFGVTGRSKSHPKPTTSWTPELATSARDRPDIPPCPPKQRFKNASFCKVKTLLWSS